LFVVPIQSLANRISCFAGSWTAANVLDWLRQRGFSKNVQKAFEYVDGSDLLSDLFTDVKSIESMGVSLKESFRVKQEIKKLKEQPHTQAHRH